MNDVALTPLPRSPTLVLNGVAIDLRNETLSQPEGGSVSLRPQAFSVLRFLIAHPNRILSKQELVDAVWNGVAVTDDSVVQCIHEIRRALCDHQHSVVQTASRRGYRLVLSQAKLPPSSADPSIAVLPFWQLDGQDRAEFAEGLTQDIAAGLCKIQGLLVVAARLRERADPRQVAAELAVRYLLNGSVRRSGTQLRIVVELIDGVTGGLVWTSKFDETDGEIFDLQDRVSAQIVGAVEPAIRHAEIRRVRRKRPEDLDAYESCLKAIPHVLANTKEHGKTAIQLLNGALEIDPEYIPAHAYAAWSREQLYLRNGLDPADKAAALAHADVALGVGSDDPHAIGIAAFVRGNLTQDYDAAAVHLDRALAQNGSSPLTLGLSALVSAHGEHFARARDHAEKALQLSSPGDPLNYHPYCALTLATLFAGEFADAERYAIAAIRANPVFSVSYAYLATSLFRLGKLDAARRAARRLMAVSPSYNVHAFEKTTLFRPRNVELIADSLRTVGVP